MHPLLTDRKRLALYLLTWVIVALLLAVVVTEPGRIDLWMAIALTVPPSMLFAFVCLATFYPTRAMPLTTARASSILLTHGVAASVLSAGWLLLFRGWARVLAIEPAHIALFFVTGVLLYLLAVAFHYLLIGIEDARRIEITKREAELKALKAQLDPHLLFNALNSISSLCGSDPSSARTLTTLLADYLRKSLRIGSSESITLSEELELASSYLAIERIRFGSRLQVAQDIDERVRGYRVPPLLLQPLVENAVTHGIGHLLDGGIVNIAACNDNGFVRISVENRCDPDRPPSRGAGIGLENTRRRVDAYYGSMGRVDVTNEPERFRVELWLPA
ncbi:MAG TPA: histidine kinase [Thermoanaerobaculia bacterium]|nr:histidine kinase [Thermoanaerobaculia bacterium]